MKMMIDVTFDFTSDSIGYWEGFWDRNNGLGAGGSDPDNSSPTLQYYHKLLWSKPLPNGEVMDLCPGCGSNYLTWKDFRFGSDSVIVTFRYNKYRYMIEQVMQRVENYKSYYEDLLRRAYTIGGMIIFPKHSRSLNQVRGTNCLIADRWDLTLECIRRYYAGEESPLREILEYDKDFFEMFLTFKGYVDFFFLQDAVTDDYSTVNIWCGNADFVDEALPRTVEEYFAFVDREMDFLTKRNARIKEYSDLYLTQEKRYFCNDQV